VKKDPCNKHQLPLPDRYRNENEAIEELLRMNSYFGVHSDFPYVMFPDFGKQEFNSNSYISSLLNHAGYGTGFSTGANTPGWENRIPGRSFNAPVFLQR
jgi:hypothetical protein